MNKHIKFVKEWLADNECKTQIELDGNAVDAYEEAAAAYAAYASDDADKAFASGASVASAYSSGGYVASAYSSVAASAADNAAYFAMKGDVENAAKYVKRYEKLAQKEG